LVPPRVIRRIAAAGAVWGIATPYLKGRGEASVRDANASLDSRAYGTFSPGALRALVNTASAGMAALPSLRLPVLVVHSDGAHRGHRSLSLFHDPGSHAFHTIDDGRSARAAGSAAAPLRRSGAAAGGTATLLCSRPALSAGFLRRPLSGRAAPARLPRRCKL